MVIRSGDVKLLKSAVMADVPEGGGARTGGEVGEHQVNFAIYQGVAFLLVGAGCQAGGELVGDHLEGGARGGRKRGDDAADRLCFA